MGVSVNHTQVMLNTSGDASAAISTILAAGAATSKHTAQCRTLCCKLCQIGLQTTEIV